MGTWGSLPSCSNWTAHPLKLLVVTSTLIYSLEANEKIQHTPKGREGSPTSCRSKCRIIFGQVLGSQHVTYDSNKDTQSLRINITQHSRLLRGEL